MKRSTNHLGLLATINEDKREISQEISRLRREIDALRDQISDLVMESAAFPSEEDAESMEFEELADTVQHLVDEEDQHLLDNDEPACPRCFGKGAATEENAAVRRCSACQTVYTPDGVTVTFEQALVFVAFRENVTMYQSYSRSAGFGFDFTLSDFDEVIRGDDAGRIPHYTEGRLSGVAMKDSKRVVCWN